MDINLPEARFVHLCHLRSGLTDKLVFNLFQFNNQWIFRIFGISLKNTKYL